MATFRAALLGFSALTLAACATTESTSPDFAELPQTTKDLLQTVSSDEGTTYGLTQATMRTAVLNEDGKPVGLKTYSQPSEAIRAGDTAAFIAGVKASKVTGDNDSELATIVTAIDQAAGGQYADAVLTLDTALQDDVNGDMAQFLQSWFLAMDGKGNEAISAHRRVSGNLPGLTGDLSLAALLEALGRNDEALAVYESMTPSQITAPEHEFDPQGLVFSHVRLVVARRALLLRRLGRVQEAQDVYRQLAAAEPEEAVSYAAAIDALATGRGLDDDALTLKNGFSRAMTDYSRSLAYQRIIAGIMMGNRPRGYDDMRGAFDQLALLIDDDNDDLRLQVFDQLYEDALYDGARHVLETAPKATKDLKVAEASLLVRTDDFKGADKALQAAIKLSDDDEQLSINTTAMRLYALMDKEEEALEIAAKLPDYAQSPAERATAFGISSSIYAQFAKYQDALAKSRAARALDDTHDRRVALSDALAKAGRIDEGLELLRTEALTRPNDPYMLNTLGYYLVEHTDRLDEAYRVLARASALAPNDPYIADSFGWVRYALGDLDGARRYIEISRRELAPNRHWEIEDHLGDIYWHLGRKDDAKEAWGFALNEYPPESARVKIEDKLANGIGEPAPEKQDLPDVSLGRDAEVERNDI